MTGFTFNKSTAEYFIRCLDKQQVIEPPGGEWTNDNMVMLAGVCHCVVACQGPRWQEAMGVDVSQLSDEQREACDAAIVPELSAAMEWISERCVSVIDGSYDLTFEAEHSALITVDGGERRFMPVEGFKDDESDDTGNAGDHR